uniref:Uncharacterized protein n=1 Tax=Ciona intestinalis TaxID=7719 RepID=H2Y028_CIOIN
MINQRGIIYYLLQKQRSLMIVEIHSFVINKLL